MTAELVADMPHRQRWMLGIPLREPLDQVLRGKAIDGAARAVMLASAMPEADSVGRHREHLRVLVREPRRRRRRGRRQVDADTALMEHVHDPVEPVEFVPGRFGLQARPGEDAKGNEVDARLLHEPDVFLPHRLRPLVGVVITAVSDVRQPFAEERASPWGWGGRVCAQPFVDPSVRPEMNCFCSTM